MQTIAHSGATTRAAFAFSSKFASTAWVSRIVMLGATSIVFGILWDISWHRTIGRDTFWTPAHLAIQLGGLLGGFTAGWLVLRTTFWGTAQEKSAAVRLWGFSGPLGAWVTIWGCLAMLTSAPFDNWWHDAYGLDVKILSPPHTVLALGMWSVVLGALLLVLREQNNASEDQGHLFSPSLSSIPNEGEVARRAGEESPRLSTLSVKPAPGRGFFIYGGGVLLAMASVFLTEMSFPNQQHSAPFFIFSAALYPLYLVGVARAARFRWSATLIALVYMLIIAVMAWVLPLFPGQPKLGPINNHVTYFVPLPFPLLLIVPALALDLIRHWLGAGRGWRRDVLIILLSTVAFVVLFTITQWWFSKFLLSAAGQNWFFAADRHWGYTESLGANRQRFWEVFNPAAHRTATLRLIGLTTLLAAASSTLGLLLGNWMAKVRR